MTNEVDDIKQRINNFLEMDDQNDHNIRSSINDFRQSKQQTNLQSLFDVEKAAREETQPEQQYDNGDFFRDFVSKIEQKHKGNEPDAFDFYGATFQTKEKKPYAKYDDSAFKRDLEMMKNPDAEELDVKNIIRTALQVEDETRQMKSKITGGKYDALYQEEKKTNKRQTSTNNFVHKNKSVAKAPENYEFSNQDLAFGKAISKPKTKEEKKIAETQNHLINKVMKEKGAPDEAAEDMLLAFDLLNKYKKDSKFIQKELNAQQKESKLIIRDEEEKALPGKKAAYVNTLLTQEERHRQIAEKREKRKQEQKLKEEEKERQAKEQKNERIRKQTRTKLDNMKNSDIANVMETRETKKDSFFVTQDQDDDLFDEVDPRQSVRLQKVIEAKKKINQQTEEYELEVKKMQNEIKQYKEEIKKQQMAEKQKQTQMQMKEQLQIEKNQMEIEMKNSMLQMRNFKLNKLIVILNSLVVRKTRSHKIASFNQLQAHSLQLGLKFIKLSKHVTFDRKHKILKNWNRFVKTRINEREIEKYEAAKQAFRMLQDKADKMKLHTLYKLTLKSLKANISQSQAEMEIEREHEKRKDQIDNFFANLRNKVENERQQKAMEEEKQEIKNKLRDNQYQEAKEQSEQQFDSIKMEITPFRDFAARLENENEQRLQATAEDEVQVEEAKELNGEYVNEVARSESIRESIQQSETDLQIMGPLPIMPNQSMSDIGLMNLNLGEQMRALPPAVHSKNESESNYQIEESKASQAPSQATESRISQSHNRRDSAAKKKKDLNPKVKERYEKQAQQRPKHILDMEQRAKERQMKREQLQQLYEEKRLAQEEQKREQQKAEELATQQKIVEEKERKRQIKADERKAQEQARLDKEHALDRVQGAREFYNLKLLRKYILGTFEGLIMIKQAKTMRADEFHCKQIKAYGLLKLRNAVAIQQFANQERMGKLHQTADSFYEFNVQVNVWHELVQHVKREKEFANFHRRQIHDKWTKVRFFGIFKKLTMFLKEENKIILEHQMKVVRKFRLIKTGRKILRALQAHTEEEKVNRDKDVYKNKIFDKVQMWLKEYDEKDITIKSIESKKQDENVNVKNTPEQNTTDPKIHDKLFSLQTIHPRVDEYSFMSKDMFDEKFEMTKDELFSNQDYNAMVLNSRNDSKLKLKKELQGSAESNTLELNKTNNTLSRLEELNNTGMTLPSKNDTLEFFDKELNKILSLQEQQKHIVIDDQQPSEYATN